MDVGWLESENQGWNPGAKHAAMAILAISRKTGVRSTVSAAKARNINKSLILGVGWLGVGVAPGMEPGGVISVEYSNLRSGRQTWSGKTR